jgi:gluconate 2-dehydrogenase gamma chain
VLTSFEATEVEAIAAQIIPTDDTPGAHEAGVVYFVDGAFDTFMSGAVPGFRAGLEGFQSSVRERFPSVRTFSELQPPQQIEALRDAESSPFFGLIRYLTIAGMFALPAYGGNRDNIGWRLIGFDDRHVWQPPFGYYDEAER